jgi:hypothetical protein
VGEPDDLCAFAHPNDVNRVVAFVASRPEFDFDAIVCPVDARAAWTNEGVSSTKAWVDAADTQVWRVGVTRSTPPDELRLDRRPTGKPESVAVPPPLTREKEER